MEKDENNENDTTPENNPKMDRNQDTENLNILLKGKANSSYEILDHDDNAKKPIETLDDNIEKYADTSNLEDISQDIHNDIIRRHQEHNKQILGNREELKQNNIRHKNKRENHNYLNVKRKASYPSTKWIIKN